MSRESKSGVGYTVKKQCRLDKLQFQDQWYAVLPVDEIDSPIPDRPKAVVDCPYHRLGDGSLVVFRLNRSYHHLLPEAVSYPDVSPKQGPFVDGVAIATAKEDDGGLPRRVDCWLVGLDHHGVALVVQAVYMAVGNVD